MSKLKAKDPKATTPSKPKILISGPPGVGKTWFSLDFPAVYYIDTEGGANLPHYTSKLVKSGGVYMGQQDGTLDPETIIEQFQALATERHKYKTVVVDSITKVFNSVIAREQERLGDKDAFGASKKPAVSFMRRLVMWTDRLDMNVVFVAHEKAEWGLDKNGDRTQIGMTADIWEKLAYELHLWLHASIRGSVREFTTRKTRIEAFPINERFALDFGSFASRWGADVINKPPDAINLATSEQLTEITRLLDVVKTSEEETAKVLTKAGVDTWSELTTEQASKTIDWLKKKVS